MSKDSGYVLQIDTEEVQWADSYHDDMYGERIFGCGGPDDSNDYREYNGLSIDLVDDILGFGKEFPNAYEKLRAEIIELGRGREEEDVIVLLEKYKRLGKWK